MTEVWGILNLTPDSFSDGGAYRSVDAALDRAREYILHGASVVDVGGESSRPPGTYGSGAHKISADEEWSRISEVVKRLVAEGIRVSVDTVKGDVAAAALAEGAAIINDVSMGRDDTLLQAVASCDCELVLMHTRGDGSPTNVTYADPVQDTHQELESAVARARGFGVESHQIWLDPGLGFAKSPEVSIELARNVGHFVRGPYRVLFGASRKAFIGALTGRQPASERLAGSLAAALWAADAGVAAVRVHDVRETVEALRFWAAMKETA